MTLVKTYYYDVYNARTLENICHREEPYIEARNGCAADGKCQDMIRKENILRYYGKVVVEYNIKLDHMEGIKKYLDKLLD